MKHALFNIIIAVVIAACSPTTNPPPSSTQPTPAPISPPVQPTCCDTRVNDIGPASNVISDSLKNFYYAFWKNELLTKSGMSESYFQQHLSNITASSGIMSPTYVYFRVDYFINIGWAKVRNYDQFYILLDLTDNAYQYLHIPRNVYLDSTWTQFCIDHNVFSTRISYIRSVDSLAFNSYSTAADTLRTKTGYPQICPSTLSLASDGYIYLSGYGTLDYANNKCVQGSINLVTGATLATPVRCYY